MILPKTRLCIYCGSREGENSKYSEVAAQLGAKLANSGVGLVYGGGTSGLMGVVANAAKCNGGHVTGIMPSSLVSTELAFQNADVYHEVDTFHERKRLMAQFADGFIVLPGGPGTLEEVIEQLTLSQLGHNKPIIIVNTDGFWNYLADLIESVVIGGKRPNCVFVAEPELAVTACLAQIAGYE